MNIFLGKQPGKPGRVRRREPRLEHGFSLIELMVAITLGLLLVATIGSIFVGSSKSYREDDQYARMQENGRFALQAILSDLSMAGMWGTVPDGSSVSGAAISALCNVTGTTPETTNPIAILNNPADGSAASTAFNCIDSARFFTGSATKGDVLAIKRVRGDPMSGATISSSEKGVFVEIAASNQLVGTIVAKTGVTNTFEAAKYYWQYVPRIYYVRNYFVTEADQVPTLCRKDLTVVSGALTFRDTPLADNVENIQIEFGIDTDGDGAPNYYEPNPSAANLQNASIARAYVLVRTSGIDPTYTDTKSYSLGSVTILAPGDRYRRKVYSGTVKLRNIVRG